MSLFLFEILSLLAIIALILYIYKFHLKNDFSNHFDKISTLLKEGLNKQTQNISAQFGVSKNSEATGLVDLQLDAANIDFDSLIINSNKLIILLNDGRTWLSVQRDHLRKRFSDPKKETTLFIIHPDSPMINVLSRKGSIEPYSLIQRINETLQLLKEISVEDTNLEILGHHLFNPHSMILTEDTAIVIPYFVSRGGRTVPAFRYDHINDDECYYNRLSEDLEKLRMDSQSLIHSKTENLLSSNIYDSVTMDKNTGKKIVNISNSFKKSNK